MRRAIYKLGPRGILTIVHARGTEYTTFLIDRQAEVRRFIISVAGLPTFIFQTCDILGSPHHNPAVLATHTMRTTLRLQRSKSLKLGGILLHSTKTYIKNLM